MGRSVLEGEGKTPELKERDVATRRVLRVLVKHRKVHEFLEQRQSTLEEEVLVPSNPDVYGEDHPAW